MNGHLKPLRKIAFIVIAQDESAVIGRTVKNICSTLRKKDALFVVSDNSKDDTALIARQSGTEVIRRVSGKKGKGAALAWFMLSHRQQLAEFDCVVILDADSSIGKDFANQLSGAWTDKTLAAQCFLQPVDYEGTPLGNVIAMAEIVEQDMFDALRSALGFSVRLRGTGMAFDPVFLIELCPFIETEVEDIALSLLVAQRGARVQRIRGAIVNDPKPTERNAASRQRGRWYRGQWKALREYHREVVHLLLCGPKGWAVLGSLFLKPRWLKLFCLCAIGAAFFWLPSVSIFFFALVSIDMFLILLGIARLGNKNLIFRSLVHVPGFVWMWIKALVFSFNKQPWPRVREPGRIREPMTEGTQVTTHIDAQIN